MAKSLLLVDDHEIFRAGVTGLIGAVYPEFTLYEAASAEEATRILGEQHIDLVVLDHELPDTNGLELVPILRREYPDLTIVMLTGAHSGALVRQLVNSGASAVLAKRGSGDELLEIINQNLGADTYVSDSFSDELARVDVIDKLTNRERECLNLLLKGLSTKQIADQMQVSYKTADTHRSNLMTKLNVHSYGQLVALATDMKLHL